MARSAYDPFSLLESGALLGLLPLAMAQRALFRRLPARSPEAAGARSGWTGPADGPVLRLLVAGEAAAVGVGVSEFEQSLAPRLASMLSLQLRCRIEWQAFGGNGWTAARLARALRQQELPGPDIAVLLVGGADAMALTGFDRWRRGVLDARAALLERGTRLLAFTAVPPMARLTALPWPLNSLLGQRGERLDRLLRDALGTSPLAPERSVLHVPIVGDVAPMLGADGLHPSARGYALWARLLGQALLAEWQILPLAGLPRERSSPVRG